MEDATERTRLPDYQNPPVVETILGVQFERLPGFKNAHLGAFWKTLDPSKWPAVSDAQPLGARFERFAEAARWAKGIQLQLTQDPCSRLQIKNRDGDRMIQIQNGRLHFNWLGQTGGKYPRYDVVREGFVWAFGQFVGFLAEEGLGGFRPNQWEVTYLNHLPQGTVWHTPSDWGFFRPLRAIPSVEGMIHGESFTGAWHFAIPGERGRLHIEWQHGKRADPKAAEIIVLTFTARGPVAEEGDALQAVLDGVDLGRAAIVRSFAEFMCDEANRYWGLKDASD